MANGTISASAQDCGGQLRLLAAAGGFGRQPGGEHRPDMHALLLVWTRCSGPAKQAPRQQPVGAESQAGASESQSPTHAMIP